MEFIKPQRDIWFITDTHFGHANFLTFLDDQGKNIRKFDSVQDMDDCMITRWNERIKPEDRVYHLGDVGSDPQTNARILPMLNGSKRLLLGNHDTIKGDLENYFKKITMWRIFKEYDFVCSHLPLRDDSMWNITFNVHGHIHQHQEPSLRHMNICVEKTDYKPLHLDEILTELTRRRPLLQTV